MEGLSLLFEASAVGSTLMGEPMLVIIFLSVIHFFYPMVQATLHDGILYIFIGALWIALWARSFEWKAKGNPIEALYIVTFTCVILPKYVVSGNARLAMVLLMYIFVTERIEPSLIIGAFYILMHYSYLVVDVPLVLVVYTTFALMVFFWARTFKWKS